MLRAMIVRKRPKIVAATMVEVLVEVVFGTEVLVGVGLEIGAVSGVPSAGVGAMMGVERQRSGLCWIGDRYDWKAFVSGIDGCRRVPPPVDSDSARSSRGGRRRKERKRKRSSNDQKPSQLQLRLTSRKSSIGIIRKNKIMRDSETRKPFEKSKLYGRIQNAGDASRDMQQQQEKRAKFLSLTKCKHVRKSNIENQRNRVQQKTRRQAELKTGSTVGP